MAKSNGSALADRTIYVHPMTRAGARLLTATLRSAGFDARVTPPSDDRTLELGAAWSEGDECLPKKITLGDYMKVTEQPGFDPSKTAFFMPTAGGPCRFGQYSPALETILRKRGLAEAKVVSPTSSNGYEGFGTSISLYRTAWTALLAADIVRKLLLKTRPYELHAGDTDRVYEETLSRLEALLAEPLVPFHKRFRAVSGELRSARERFRAVQADYVKGKPLIAVVGEIFCRHNRFANEDILRTLEANGAETWLADVGEWVIYTDWSRMDNLKRRGKRWSLETLGTKLKLMVMKHDEHHLLHPFHDDFVGYEEPASTDVIAGYAEPYLPLGRALGEMALSLGRAGYCHDMGVDAIVDISPFSCMNGIVSEAVYPSFSRDHNDIPCRVFYFDGVNADIDRDIAIFMELVRGYMSRKCVERRYPAFFRDA